MERFGLKAKMRLEQVGVCAAPGHLPIYDVEGSSGTEWALFFRSLLRRF